MSMSGRQAESAMGSWGMVCHNCHTPRASNLRFDGELYHVEYGMCCVCGDDADERTYTETEMLNRGFRV